MNKQGKKLLELLYNPGEHVYAQPTKASSKWDDEKDEWAYYLPSVLVEQVPMDTTTLISLNPTKGDVRNDENVTAYRSFMIEMDELPLDEQMKVVEASGVPYTVCVFSGSRSLHFVITLDKDLPTREIYVMYAKWLMATIPGCDVNNFPPSRATRFPGVMRKEKGKKQILVKTKDRVSHVKLMAYLAKHKDKMPKPEAKDEDFVPKAHNKGAMREWVLKGLNAGFDFTNGRNQTWFAIGFEFGKCGYTLEQCVEACESQFSADRDFQRREWEACLKNGHKKAIRTYWSGK